MAEDRLAGIKMKIARYGGIDRGDDAWLISELEQARARVKELERDLKNFEARRSIHYDAMRERAAQLAESSARECDENCCGPQIAAAISGLPDA